MRELLDSNSEAEVLEPKRLINNFTVGSIESVKTNVAIVLDQLFYYFSVLLPLILYVWIFKSLFINEDITTLSSTSGRLLFASKFIWFTGIMLSISNIVGLLLYGSPYKKDLDIVKDFENTGWNQDKKLIIAYVSRGDNRKALSRAVQQTTAILREYGANYHIEIVTDIPVSHRVDISRLHVSFYLVPKEYQTKRGARYKARALHYLSEQRQKAAYATNKNLDTWILHLDEESVITKQSLAGISEYINNPKYANSIGQGEIKYNSHQYGKRLLITAIDAVRTGDDLGRFRFQYKLAKNPIFGMHGSYFLVPEKLESSQGFDLGGKGSITEDAYFAFHAIEKGVPFNWIHGFIREQSPFSIAAILRQRRRWYCGLMTLSFDKELKLKTRLFLMLNMLFWTVSWSGPIFTIANLAYRNGYSPLTLTIAAAIIQGSYCATYLVGAYRGVIGSGLGMPKRVLLYLITFILFPISNTIEGIAILYGIIRPVKTFDVVKK